ncbi:MAG: RagB/SusD family nutrient uptake outer membrane protein [Chitinophagaceae bacterium]|nr:RagB/SusD family nutrient uptake outer membrane protein [Chitinophagaceae bacterium]
MKHILIMFSVIIALVSCGKKDLDIVPSDKLSDATVWTQASTASLFLSDIYNSLNAGPYPAVSRENPSEISNDPLDNFTDNATYGPEAGLPSAQIFNSGSYGPSSQLFPNQWKYMYANIRKCNLFLEKIAPADLPDNDKKNMIAQARFLRAYFYKQLVDLYGGVPIIVKVLNNDGKEDIFYPRSSYNESVDFILKECREAAADLPLTVSGINIGRATKGAALALKGEEELYAGRWEAAAATHKEIIELNVYGLFPDYTGLFSAANENNKEVLFDIQFAPNVKFKNINQYWGVVEVAKGAGWGACDPTQNLVDEYEFIDGKTAAEGSIYYDPSKPYENREKRFYESIIYDGCAWRGKTIYTRLGIPNNANEINITGKSGNAGRTGYFVRKLQDSTIGSTPGTLDGANFIVYRYGEVLLNYAEARNEVSGPDLSVYNAVNEVRRRAGQPDLPTGFTQEQMRMRIRRERRIELAFEGKYFYDIMRWKTAVEIFSQPIYGMKITASGSDLTYEKIKVRQVVFDPSKHYLQPIPQSAIDQNSKLVQNPNY